MGVPTPISPLRIPILDSTVAQATVGFAVGPRPWVACARFQASLGVVGAALRFNAGGFGYLCYRDGKPPIACKNLLQESLWLNEQGDRVALLKPSGAILWLQPQIETPRYGRFVQSDKHARLEVKLWPRSWQFRGCQLWLELLPILGFIWQTNDIEEMARPLLNAWPHFEKWLEPIMPVALVLHRCMDRRKRDTSWFRFLPEHSVSVVGLLAIFGMWETRCRETGRFSGDLIFEMLDLLLRTLLKKTSSRAPARSRRAVRFGLLTCRTPSPPGHRNGLHSQRLHNRLGRSCVHR